MSAFSVADGDTAYPDGCLSDSGTIMGTYLHGLFQDQPVRHAFIAWLAHQKGAVPQLYSVGSRDEQYDRLAELLQSHLDIPDLFRIADLPPPASNWLPLSGRSSAPSS